MPAVVQSTIDLLETELVKARAALQDIHPNVIPAYRENLISRAPDFFYGTRRLTCKELGLVSAVSEMPAGPETGKDSVDSGSVKPSEPASFEDVLSNTLILDQLAPYLSPESLLSLASTSRYLRSAILETPYVFRHLDLSRSHAAQIPNHGPGGGSISQEWLDQNMTEDEFYSAPLARIFTKLEQRSILQDVRTLILDGLTVPADLVAGIVLSDRFNVNILSIRECQHLNERKLMQVLQYAARPTRPEGTPRVKGIYYFTPVNAGAMSRSSYRDWWSSRCTGTTPPAQSPTDEDVRLPSEGRTRSYCQNAWYAPSGKLLKGSIEDGWAQTLQRCEGVIAFDAVLCRGPRHNIDLHSSGGPDMPPGGLLGPAISTIALGPRGCDDCHNAPEGPAIWGESPDEQFPLLAPPPLHSSTVTAAKRPALFPDEHPALITRCTECLADRWCHSCNKWFCYNCLPHPGQVSSRLSPHQTAVRGRRRSSLSAWDRTVRSPMVMKEEANHVL